MNHTAAPILLGLLAALTWGAADFAGGLAARRGRPSQVIFVAHGCSLILLALLLFLRGVPAMSPQTLAWGLGSGISGGVALMLFYEALALGGMGLSAALAGVLTAAVPVAISLARQGSPGNWPLLGFAVAALAIALIAWSPGDLERPRDLVRARTLGLATVAGLGFGAQLVSLHVASAQCSVLGALTLSRLGGTATGGAVMLVTAFRRPRIKRPPDNHLPGKPAPTSRHWLHSFAALAAIAGLLDTSGNGLYMASALAGRADIAAVLSSLYPGSTILLAAWLLKERTSRLQGAGMALALVAVALISL